jgi:hypothetical protein
MGVVSFYKAGLDITIHNRYPDIELTSPVYFSAGTTCHVPPYQQLDTENTLKISFEIDFKQEDVKGAMLYKLQRKYATRTDNCSNSSITFTEDTTNVYLLVVWDVENYEHGFCVCLIECADDFIWDEDKLWMLCCNYNDQFSKNYKYRTITWQMHNGAMVEMRRSVAYGLKYELGIAISEGTEKYNMEEPIQVDPERLVLSLTILIVLMYIVSLPAQPTVKLAIHNQCSNVDLVSPIYITDSGLECHRPSSHKVGAGNTTRFGFIIYILDNKFSGALIYKLQKRGSFRFIEIGNNTSNDAQLLVVWKISESKELYADALLVEHQKRFHWNKDNLR